MDLISRQDAIDAINSHFGFNIEEEYGSAVQEVINGLPSAESKTGHWIGHREHCENLGVIPSGLSAYEWCSNCDCGIDVREWHRNHYNYCPNCGSDMQERREDDKRKGD